jgi:hypothetical protein
MENETQYSGIRELEVTAESAMYGVVSAGDDPGNAIDKRALNVCTRHYTPRLDATLLK